MSNLYFNNKLLFTDRRESIDPILKSQRKNKLKKARKKQRVRRNKKTRLASGLNSMNKNDMLKLMLDVMGKSKEGDERKSLKNKKPRRMKLATLRGQGVSKGGYGLGRISNKKESKVPTDNQIKKKKGESSREYYIRLATLFEGMPKSQEMMIALSATENNRPTTKETHQMIGRAAGQIRGSGLIDFQKRAPEEDITTTGQRKVVPASAPEPEPASESAPEPASAP